MSQKQYRSEPIVKLKRNLGIPFPPIQVFMGPRQVGKTTSILAYLKEWNEPAFYHTADQIAPPEASWIEEKWKEAREKLSGKRRGLLVFDEVQKIPRWSEAVKKCFDEDRRAERPLHVVILGSSSLLVQKGLTESLAGRFEIIPFPHWSFKECRDVFGITFEEFIFFGGYPGALQILLESNHNEDRWRDYVRNALIETVLNKDILLLSPVSKPALFRQVFQLAMSHPAEILSLNKMLGQLHEAGNASTVASYLRLMEAALLLKTLEKFSGTKLRQKTSSPKLITLNNALINASLERGLKETRENASLWGRLIENAVAAELINKALGHGLEIFYWRERDKEVDFVLQQGTKIAALEIKSGESKQRKGLNEFQKKYSPVKTLTIAPDGGDISLKSFFEIGLEEIF